MNIKNIEGLTPQQIRDDINNGGKFVFYKYCISILVMTFNNPTDIHFIRPGASAVTPGLGPLFCNLFLGWWGIPWGPIYTIGNIYTILTGGKDVTQEVLASINQNAPDYGTGNSYNIPGASSGGGTQSSGGENVYNIPR